MPSTFHCKTIRHCTLLHRSLYLFVVVATTVILFSSSASAQFSGLQGNSDIGSSDSRNVGSGDSGIGTGLDATDAFSDLQRGDDVGSTENTGRGFSGSSVAAPQSGAGNVTPGGIGGGLGGFGGIGGFGGMFGGANTAAAESTPPVIRTRLRSAVQVEPRAPYHVQQVATGRFQSLPRRPQLRNVNISMQGRTAVLQGQVSSESDRRMSQLLMQLEPGVSRVENRVIVSP